MAGSTLTTFDSVLKETYLGPIRDQLNSKTTIYGKLPKKDRLDGRRLVIPIRTGRNRSYGFQAAGDPLKTAKNQVYNDANVPPLYYYGTVEVGNEVIVQSRTSRGAFARAIKTEMEGLPLDMRDDLDRIVCGNGDATIGVIATSGITGETVTLVDPEDARKFGVGMVCEFFDDSVPDQPAATDGSVTGVDLDAGTVTFTDISTGGLVADDDVITISGARSVATAGPVATIFEMMGLGGICGTGNPTLRTTLQGLDADTISAWNCFVDTSATKRAVSNKLLQKLIDGARIRGNGKPDLFVVPYGVRFEYADIQLNVRRNTNTNVISGMTSGGFREDEESMDLIEYNGIEFCPDKYAIQNEILLVDTQSTYVARFADFDWMDLDGSILHRSPSGVPTYQATMYFYGELVTEARNRNAKATDVLGDDPA